MKPTELKNLIRVLMTLLILLTFAVNAAPARAGEPEGEGSQGEELVIDLRDGYEVFEDAGWYYNAKVCMAVKNAVKICEQNNVDWCIFSGDVDGDGTPDFETGGYNYPYEEYPTPAMWCLIPTVECSAHGRFSLPVGKIDYESYRKYDTVTFIFPDEPIKNEYSISVEKGHAESSDGRTITSAAPGVSIILVPDVLEGEYVSSWKSDVIGSFSRYDNMENRWCESVSFFMPASDVSMKAATEKQQPLSFDMTEGFCLADGDYYLEPNYIDLDLSFAASDNMDEYSQVSTYRMDLDQDGSFDIICCFTGYTEDKYGRFPDRVYFIPLSTGSINGTYSTAGQSLSPYWPYTFVFPQKAVNNLYPVTVTGGHAEDMNGRTITEAAPGEAIRIIYDGSQGATAGLISSPQYENLYKDWTWEGERSVKRLREEIAMPACALSYKALPNEGKTLELSFYLDGDSYRAVLPEAVADALKNNESKREQIFRFISGYEPSVVDRALRLTNFGWGDYYSLGYSLQEPFITDEETYTEIDIRFQGKTLYPIVCTDEAIKVYYNQPDENPGIRIVASAADQVLYVNKSRLTEEDGYEFLGFEAKDFFMEYNGYYWRFIMPDHEIELKPVFQKVDTSKQTPLTIDLSSGNADISDPEIWKSIERTGIRISSNGQMYDLNGDGQWDVKQDDLGRKIRRLGDYSCPTSYTIKDANHGQKYYPITFVCNRKTEDRPEITPTSAPDEGEGQKNESSGKPAEKPAGKSKKGGTVLLVFAVLAVILAFGGGVAYCVIRNRKEAEKEKLRREKLAARRRQRDMEDEDFAEPPYEETEEDEEPPKEQTEEQDESGDEEKEDEEYL
ncbi:MAG: hypothetical protein J5643_05410 [Lachnospiraceae bacterium]|nr:hypothetical protein [Lachnospiraceae bacterium]